MGVEFSSQPVVPGQTFVKKWLTIVGPFLGLLFVVGAFAILTGTPDKYLSPFNIRVVLSQTVIVAIGAIGMTMIIVSGGVDLSVGSTIALSGVLTAPGLNPGIGAVLAACGGNLAGRGGG